MDVPLLLVPSPLLGSAAWGELPDWLRRHGREVVVVETGRPLGPGDVISSVIDVGHQIGPLVLVPHSNAGLYVPVLRTELDVRATVFVDAALPMAGPTTPLAPPALLQMLRALADADGLLPPWSQWWEDLTGVFPSDDVRREVERTQPRLPLSYFSATLPVPDGWKERPCAYLAFGDTYADEVAFAREQGWPVSVVPGRHLQHLHHPAGVGAEILRLDAALRA